MVCAFLCAARDVRGAGLLLLLPYWTRPTPSESCAPPWASAELESGAEAPQQGCCCYYPRSVPFIAPPGAYAASAELEPRNAAAAATLLDKVNLDAFQVLCAARGERGAGAGRLLLLPYSSLRAASPPGAPGQE